MIIMALYFKILNMELEVRLSSHHNGIRHSWSQSVVQAQIKIGNQVQKIRKNQINLYLGVQEFYNMEDNSLREISYLCGVCKRQRKVSLEKDVHLNRHELENNGLASYIDIHTSKPESHDLHGVKIFVDRNFHVRTNDPINLAEKKKTAIALPIPTRKIKEMNTRHKWVSWAKLELEAKGSKIKFNLENRAIIKETLATMNFISPLGTILCNIIPAYDPVENETEVANLAQWLQAFIRAMEIASDLHIDLVPEILRYIDLNCTKPLTKTQEDIISILLDKATVLIPYKPSLEVIIESKNLIKVPGLNPEDIKRIARKILNFGKFSMAEIQKILEDEILTYSELEEEIIVLAISQLIMLDAFDYKLSFLKEAEQTKVI